MFTDMEKWTEIRRDVLVEGKSKRQVQRETGLSWKTLEKVLTHSSPPGYRRTKSVSGCQYSMTEPLSPPPVHGYTTRAGGTAPGAWMSIPRMDRTRRPRVKARVARRNRDG